VEREERVVVAAERVLRQQLVIARDSDVCLVRFEDIVLEQYLVLARGFLSVVLMGEIDAVCYREIRGATHT